MKIYNPSNKAITDVKIFGVSYSIDAEGTLENVPEEVARYWQENLHKFLQIKKDGLEGKVEATPKAKVETKDESVSTETEDDTKIPEPKVETKPTKEAKEEVKSVK